MSEELFFEWLSECGAGRWEEFRTAHEWLEETGDGLLTSAALSCVFTLTMLGHIEMDWITRSWAVAPATVTMLPDAGGHALVSGSRTRQLLQELDAYTDRDELWLHKQPQAAAPDALFVQCRHEEHIEMLASALGIQYVASVSETLSHMLPDLAAYLEAATSTPPPRGLEANKFDPSSLTWRVVSAYDAPGLYNFKVYGKPTYRWLASNQVHYDVPWPIGVFAELSATRRQVLMFEPDGATGTLCVPGGTPLPALQSRAAALCSGLAPLRVQNEWRYLNVPQRIATRIAKSLDQTLAEKQAVGFAPPVSRPLYRRGANA